MSSIPCIFEPILNGPLWELGSRDSEQSEPPPYSAIAEPSSLYRSDVLDTIEDTVASYDGELRDLSLKLHGRTTFLQISITIDFLVTN